MSEPKRLSRPPYPPEVRERAVRMVFDHQGEYPSQWKAIESIAEKLNIHRETLRVWVRRTSWRTTSEERRTGAAGISGPVNTTSTDEPLAWR